MKIMMMGFIYKDQGKIEEAIVSYQKALDIKPDHPYSHEGLAYIYFDLKKYDEALEHAILAEKYGLSMTALTALIERLRQGR